MRPVLTPDEVADQLGVSRKTVYRLINEGQIRAKKIGPRSIRVTQDALEGYLTGQEGPTCDRLGCGRMAVKKIGITHGEASETFVCSLHWSLDYEGRLGTHVPVTDLDHQHTQEVST